MTTASPTERLRPVSMEEAVGYPAITCTHETLAEHAVVLKHDRLFLLVNQHGDIAPPGSCALGFFQDDTRILSRYRIRVAGGPSVLLSAQTPRPYASLIDLAVHDLPFGGTAWDPRNVVHIRREMSLSDRLIERRHPHQLSPDAAGLLARAGVRRRLRRHLRGAGMAPGSPRAVLRASDRGRRHHLRLPWPRRAVAAKRGALPRSASGRRIDRADGTLASAAPGRAAGGAGVGGVGAGRRPPHLRASGAGRCERAARRRVPAWQEQGSRWTTDAGNLDHLLRRATDDLRALQVEMDGEQVISAGIPWYSTVFGRDAIITSLQALPLNASMARTTLRYLAAHQGSREDPYTEEQPGKILHELRRGEMARTGEIPHVPYYGSVDATPLWLILLHETWRWTGDVGAVPHAAAPRGPGADLDRSLRRPRRRRLRRIPPHLGEGPGQPGLEGLRRRRSLPRRPAARAPDRAGGSAGLRVRRQAPDGGALSASRPDGSCHRAPARGAEMRRRIRDAFWRKELGMFALALDRRQAPVRPRRPMRATCSGAACRRRRRPAAWRTASWSPTSSPAGASGPLSAAHPVFNPMSYHNGSVWPHDNALVVLGMALYGHARSALPVVRATLRGGDSNRVPAAAGALLRHGARAGATVRWPTR